jgi:hypothetical protein
MGRVLNRPPLVFVADNHTRLMQGFHASETFLFRVWRIDEADVTDESMETAGLDRTANPRVYYLLRDTWGGAGFDDPRLYLAGPLTLDGAAAVARTFTEAYDANTNFGAF